MWKWLKGPRQPRQEPAETVAAKAEAPVPTGRSAPLQKYLAGRYADAVVLTFAQIEDLLGFALPDAARLSRDWWTAPDPNADGRISDSWKLANRTALPNLGALTVIFERTS